jgi:nucleoid DNA-binding protein
MKKKLFDYVHEVLKKNELIIVPNFGAFIVQKTTTFLNDAEYISIIFSAQQQNDDGILCSYIAEKNNCSESDAEEFIESSLEEIYNIINESSLFVVEGIGEFRAINDRIVFKPFDEQFLLESNKAEAIENPIQASNIRIENETESEALKEPKIEEKPAVFDPIPNFGAKPETTKPLEENSKTETEKIDIEAIRKTYAERNNALNNTSTTPTNPVKKVEEAKPEETIPEESKKAPKNSASSFDFNKIKIPLFIVLIISILGILAYMFKDEIATLNKSSNTNDSTQVVIEQGMNQLADTLNEIQHAQTDSIANATSESIANAPELSTSAQESKENVSAAKAENAGRVYYGNNTSTIYYVCKASYRTKQDASAEEQTLNNTGFEARVIETDGPKKYHVTIGEYSDLQKAKDELSFAKSIDNSFYLITVKPKQ